MRQSSEHIGHVLYATLHRDVLEPAALGLLHLIELPNSIIGSR